jgi:hypothetical protein
MPVVSLCGLSFSGLARTFKLLPSKHTEASVWHARTVRAKECLFTLLGSEEARVLWEVRQDPQSCHQPEHILCWFTGMYRFGCTCSALSLTIWVNANILTSKTRF